MVADTWAPIAETIINISLAVLLGYLWGMEGVLVGSIISVVSIAVVWKSIYLCRDGLELSPWAYWRSELKFLAISALVIIGGRFVVSQASLDYSTFPLFFFNTGLILLAVVIVSYILIYVVSSGMRAFTSRVIQIVRHRML